MRTVGRWFIAMWLVGCGRVGFDAIGDGAVADAVTAAACERAPIAEPAWWVAPDGLDSNDGSRATPVATLARAVALARATGGTIVIRPGAYAEEIDLDTTVPLRIVGEQRYAARLVRIQCVGCRDLVVEGLELADPPFAGLQVTGGERVLYTDNVTHGSASAGIRIAGGSSAVRVIGNLVYDSRAQGIHVNDASDVEIRGNVVFDAAVTPNPQGKIWLEQVTGATVADNVVFRSRVDDDTFGLLALRQVSATIVENNVFAASPDAASVYAAIGFDGASGAATIRHNTFVGPFPGTAFGLGVRTMTAGSAFELVNNLWASPGTAQPFTDGTAPGGAIRLRRNLYWNAPSGGFAAGGAPQPTDDVEAIVADPQLAFIVPPAPAWSAVAGTFTGGGQTICEVHVRLALALAGVPAGSPAAGAADPAESPRADIRGRVRPSPPAVGAFEP